MTKVVEKNVVPGLEPTLPSSWYLQDKYFALELEHIFMREWICAGREEEIISARVHERGVYAPMEDWNLDIRRYVQDRIGPHAG